MLFSILSKILYNPLYLDLLKAKSSISIHNWLHYQVMSPNNNFYVPEYSLANSLKLENLD